MRFYLDGIEYDAPKGWENIQSKIVFDDDLQLLTRIEDVDLEFGGDAYAFFKSKLNAGFCAVVDLRIDEKCGTNTFNQIIRGKIFVSDISFNERTCLAKCKMEDNSYFATINNNAKIKTVMDAGVSKLGEVIAPAEVYLVDYQDLDLSAIRTVPSVRVYEAFRYLIDFMTDASVGFASSIFEMGGEWEGLSITFGSRIRTGNAIQWEQFSFEELFKEVRARIPIRMLIENPLTAPLVRIELESYFEQPGIYATDITDIYEIKTSCDKNKLYSKVKVGSSDTDDTVTLSFPEDINYFGFKTEELFLRTECNTNQELDLTGDWIVSSNVIERTASGDQTADDSFFLVDTIPRASVGGSTTNDNFLNLTPGIYYYNRRLNNEAILDRYLNGLPATATNFISQPGDGLFKAELGTNGLSGLFIVPLPPQIVDYDVELTDNGGYYDGINKFTALNAGVYDFRVVLNGRINSNPNSVSISAWIYHYDSGANLIDNYFLGNIIRYAAAGGTGPFTLTGTKRIVLRANDYCQVLVRVIFTGGTADGDFFSTSFWECYQNTNGGGEFVFSDGKDFPIFLHEFDYPLTTNEFNDLYLNARNYIRFAQAGQQLRQGRIKEIVFNRNTGLATFKLYSATNYNAS